MPQKQIPLTNQQRSSLDELSGASQICMNVVTDAGGTIYKRPCLKTPGGFYSGQINSAGVSTIHTTYDGVLYAVAPELSAYAIYRVGSAGATSLSTDLASRLLGSSRPTVVETGALLVFAANSEMQKVVLSTDVSSRLGGTPPEATHITANRLRLLANDPLVDKSKIRYSDVATGSVYTGHEVWSFAGVGTSGYTSAEARPDPIVALGETADAVYAFGSTNVQIFVSDPNLVFAPSVTLEAGCSAPYSIVRVDDAFAWLNHNKELVVASGIERRVISSDIANDLDGLDTVSDCFGYRMRIGSYDLLVWSFPTEKRTYAYQIGGGWAQWSGYDPDVANWKAFKVSCYTHNTVTDQHLVGTNDGYIAEFDVDTYTDLGDPVKAYVESGGLNRGTDNKKLCKAVHVRLKSETDTSVEPEIALSWSDYPDQWSDPIRLSIGYDAANDAVITLRSLGVYRNRNWRLEFSESSKLAIAGITEDYEVLDG